MVIMKIEKTAEAEHNRGEETMVGGDYVNEE